MFITLKLICFPAFSISGITEIESPNFCMLQVQERKILFLKKGFILSWQVTGNWVLNIKALFSTFRDVMRLHLQ